MSEFEITRTVEGSKGRYDLSTPSGKGELTYSIASPVLVIADHTEVDDGLRGSGAAQALVERLISDARAEGFKIVPLCPFVKAQARRHPEWADVIAG